MGSGISDDAPGLFGWVPAPARGMGRPPYVWTREKSNKVMVLFASGYKIKDVAAVMGCDAKTLRKVFPREVATAARAELVVRSGMMARLVDEAEKGNVGAVKQLDAMIQAERVRNTASAVKGRGQVAEQRTAKLGKKEQAKLTAEQVAGKFAPRRPPSQLVN